MLERIRIVLVRPIRPGNVGAVCRVMTNMGLRELVLVAPACDRLDEQAVGFAARARPLLEAARVVPDIATALEGCVLTLASSGKGGLYRRHAAIAPAQAAAAALDAAAAGPVALVFGPEDRGLLLEELLHFDRVVEIPADAAYPVLNLAAAAAVMCYELRRTWLERREEPSRARPWAREEQKRVLFEKLFAALETIGFFRNQQYEAHLPLALRHLLGRMDLSVNEADILIGMARQIQWYAERYGPRGDAEPDPAP
jgi:tRNA/rRNA methyltransferase